MIAHFTTAVLFLSALAAVQADGNGAENSSWMSFSFDPPTATGSSNTQGSVDNTQPTTSSESQLEAPTTTVPAATPWSDGPPRAAPMIPVTESSEQQLNTPTSTPYTFAPTSTPESDSESFVFAPTTSSIEFSFQPPEQPTTTQMQPMIVQTMKTNSQLQVPTTTPKFVFAPSSAPSQTPVPAPVASPALSHQSSKNDQKPAPTHPAGTPVVNHPVIQPTATSLQVPPAAASSKNQSPPTRPAQQRPPKSTITGPPVVKTIAVTRASNGDYMLGSLTLSNNEEITQGNTKFPTQIVELQSSSQLVIENAQTTRTQILGGQAAAPTTPAAYAKPPATQPGGQAAAPTTLATYPTTTSTAPATTMFIQPLPPYSAPPIWESKSLHGGYVLSAEGKAPVQSSSSAEDAADMVTLNDHTMTVSSAPVYTNAAITWKGHTVSMGGLTLGARPTETPSKSSGGSDDEGSESAKSTSSAEPTTVDSGAGRAAMGIGGFGLTVLGAVALLL